MSERRTNCPNCGAPIDPNKAKCDYCGTSYLDTTVLEIGSDNYVRLRFGSEVLDMRCYISSATMDIEYGDSYASRMIDGTLHRGLCRPLRTVHLELREY